MSTKLPQLLPQPRRIAFTGGVASSLVARRSERDATVPPEGYALSIRPDAIRIRHADDAGKRYALSTLAQLEMQAGPEEVPCLEIEDAPDFPVRGYMLDVSRDRVPTRETLARIVDLMALLRLNHLELYTEHTFAYPGHETVWRAASPLDAADVAWLDDVCRARGIELAANQNGFGHMGRWLKHDRYRPLAEAPDGWQTPWGTKAPPEVLHPDEASLELVLGLYGELVQHFTSRRVNIGCDETFELGQGRSRVEVAARGRGRVYLDFLLRILASLHAEGKEVLFWGDVVRQHPELACELPSRDTIALAWHYEAPTDHPLFPESLAETFALLGMSPESLRGFAAHVAPFADAELPFWVCPGTSSWNSLVGRLPNAMANLRDAAEVGRARGASGYLITDWGDNGHLQPPSVSFPPLVYGAALAWCADSNRELDLAACLDRFVFTDGAGTLGAGLALAGGVYQRTGLGWFNGSPLFYRLLARGGPFAALGSATSAGVELAVAELEEAASLIERSRPACVDGELVQRELLQAIRLARHGARRLARDEGFARHDDADLRRDLTEAIAAQRACWMLRSRPGGLDDSVARLERTLATYGA
jgi:hexosaminidase